MERFSDRAIEIINNLHTERLDYQSEYIPLIDCAHRCAAYEDIGLAPEEIPTGLELANVYSAMLLLKQYQALGTVEELSALVKARNEGQMVALDMPRKPLVWGDDEHNTCLCPYCGKDLMGIPYGERMVLQCPECGQYLDSTKTITRDEAEAALSGK